MAEMSSVRVIAGLWRGRALSFRADLGIRPTHNAIRETLFNWLQSQIADARCLDLFAGTGALGFEAMSRGAAHCAFVDQQQAVIAALRENAARFEACHMDFLCGDYKALRARLAPPYDVVFLDPPYGVYDLTEMVAWLLSEALLCAGGLIYVEGGLADEPQQWPSGIVVRRRKQSKAVFYALLEVAALAQE